MHWVPPEAGCHWLAEAEVPSCLLGGHTYFNLPASAKYQFKTIKSSTQFNLYPVGQAGDWRRETAGVLEASVHNSLC